MENNEACNIVGIGSVTMKLKHGRVKLLRNVRHVPHFKRNLISLGILDSLGCEYKGKCGVFKVSIDSRVALVGEKVNDLFIIKRVEMLKECNVFSNLYLIEVDLWHKKLSHISQKRLEALYKQDILPQEISNKLSLCEHCVLDKAKETKLHQGITGCCQFRLTNFVCV